MRLDHEQGEVRLAQERLVAQAIMSVACELRLIDLDDLVSFVRAENFANIQDLVNSSAELYFRPGTLTFAWAADARISWVGPPAISLDLEFRHRGVTVFFSLALEGTTAGVHIHHVNMEPPCDDPRDLMRRMSDAMTDALLDRGLRFAS